MSIRIEIIYSFIVSYKLRQRPDIYNWRYEAIEGILVLLDKSIKDAVCAPFLFQSFRQVIPTLLNGNIIA
jgi:hypothetical protein